MAVVVMAAVQQGQAQEEGQDWGLARCQVGLVTTPAIMLELILYC